MLRPWEHEPPSDLDKQVFEALVPADHYLRRVKAALDFESLRPLLAESYPSGTGRPAVEPVLLVKLEFLEYHYNLSDREVIAQAGVNVAFRFFLDLYLELMTCKALSRAISTTKSTDERPAPMPAFHIDVTAAHSVPRLVRRVSSASPPPPWDLELSEILTPPTDGRPQSRATPAVR